MSDEPRSYNGPRFPLSPHHLTADYYDPPDAIAAARRYIQDNYGPEQVLRPELIIVQRKRFEEK